MKTDSPSATAKLVARNLAVVASNDATARFVPPETVRLNHLLIQSFGSRGAKFLARAARHSFQRNFKFYERITIPGLALHQALRKNFIERAVRAALAEDFGQVVVLGGGFDTLALRLHREFPHVNFLELDHPATQAKKRETIEKHDLADDNFNLLAADFTRRNLPEILFDSANFRPQADTIYVCEGVLMYLDTRAVDRIFAAINHQPAARRRFVFTFLDADADGRGDFHGSTVLVRWWLALKKEPFRWGFRPALMPLFLRSRGFALKDLATADTLREIYLRPDSGELIAAAGENVGVCENLS